MSKVSIIMPVYNAERYLREAIESVLRQTYANFELLLINDRSSDESGAICREYRERDPRIVLLENDTETHGPGPTRNIGLDHATGEYIYFMDADDWIEDQLLQCAVTRMQETNADIVQFGVIYERTGGGQPSQYCWSGKNLLSKDEIKKDFFHYWEESQKSLWLYLFRKNQIQSVRFEKIIIGEDICFVLDALCKADRLAFIKNNYYHYRYSEGSTSHRWVESTIECREVLWNHQRQFLESFPGGMDKLSYAELAYRSYIWAIYHLSENCCPLSFREKRNQIEKLKLTMGFEVYRGIYPLKMKHGLMKLKYALVKYRLEWLILWLGPLFLRIFRGE